MRNNWIFRIVVLFMLLSLLPACSTPRTPVPTNTVLPLPSNTIAPPAETLIPPADTSIPPTKAPTATYTSAPTQSKFLNMLIYDTPAMYEVTIKPVQFDSLSEPIKSLPMDIYYPPSWQADQLLPAVILMNAWRQGGQWTSFSYPWDTAGQLSFYESYGRMIAANGLIAVPYETAYPDDLDAVVKYIQDNSTELGIDATRLGLFGESSNGLLAGSFSNQENRGFIKFVVYFCSVTEFVDSPYYQDNVDFCKQYGCFLGELPKVTQLRTDLPIYVVDPGNMGLENEADMEFFIQKAKKQGVPLTLVNFEFAGDGFDWKVNTFSWSSDMKTKASEIIQQAIDFMIKNTSAP
jgi:hypothetical protein